MTSNDTIIDVINLKKSFPVKTGYFFSGKTAILKAVDNVSFSVKKGETCALVGESGCGKTTTGRIIAGLAPADGGSVKFEGREILNLKGGELRKQRKNIQFIFQDPLSSLNPRMSIKEIVAEPLEIHKIVSKSELYDKVVSCLSEVGLDSSFAVRFPHQLSGGQRQRVLIARALSLSPSFLIADEPVSALDVSIQAQVINMLRDLREKLGFSCLFISHDLAVVRNFCQKAAVMYLGRIVEMADIQSLFDNPLHPYTKGLLESVPDVGRFERKPAIKGDPPDPLKIPSGCSFRPRCPKAEKICEEKEPVLEEKQQGRTAACHFA
ncbi:MAG: ABC transporter ATP-binding protein [Firmicutes bacterium]|nr:ABC transporter ATP-binding protein [Bacillota bacterium]